MRNGYKPGKALAFPPLADARWNIVSFLVFFMLQMSFLLSLHVLPIYNLDSGLYVFKSTGLP